MLLSEAGSLRSRSRGAVKAAWHWRLTGDVMMVAGVCLLAITLAVGLGWEPPVSSGVIQCPEGLQAVRLEPPHPCPPPS